jgi:RNA polymerase-binding transcription factor DksA
VSKQKTKRPLKKWQRKLINELNKTEHHTTDTMKAAVNVVKSHYTVDPMSMLVFLRGLGKNAMKRHEEVEA